MKVDVNEVLRMLEFRSRVNGVPLEQIEWVDGDVPMVADPAWVKDFLFTGLSNSDFIRSSEVVGGKIIPAFHGIS